MRHLRRRLARLAGAWLIVQTTATLAAAACPCVAPRAAAAVTCTCAHHDGGTCPMHAGRHSTCSCRSATPPADALMALLGPIATLPPAPPQMLAQNAGRHRPDPACRSIEHVTLVESPPPRA
jgi:hypothetical protein